jgi:hypothetical protein
MLMPLRMVVGFLLGFIGAQVAEAREGLTASLGVFYFTQGTETPPDGDDSSQRRVAVTTNDTFVNAGVIYMFNLIGLGFRYLDGTIDTTTKISSPSFSSSSKAAVHYQGLGLSVGYSEDLVLTATYLLNGTKTLGSAQGSGSSTTTYPGTSAYLVDVGYGFKVSNVRIGPLISLLHFDYKDEVRNGETTHLSGTFTDTYIVPYCALWFDL